MTHSKLGQNVSSGPDSNPNDALKPKEIKALLGAAIQTQSCNLEDAAWLRGTLPLVSIQCCRAVLLAAQDEIGACAEQSVALSAVAGTECPS